ncbi:MAG: CRTAC1 family protein [Acidobacteriota bacterium]
MLFTSRSCTTGHEELLTGAGRRSRSGLARGIAAAVLVLSGGMGRPALAGAPASRLHFTDVAGVSGLRFRHNFGADKLQNILMTTGSGSAFFDYDNDGWLDVLLVNGTYLDDAGRPLPNKATHLALFHNRGDGTFDNVTKSAGLVHPSYGQGCACADFDGDGYTDLYITNYGRNLFYRNRGDGTFEDVTTRTGTGDPRWSTGAVFFDYDGDGDLDLFVSNYVKFTPGQKGVHSSALSKRSGFRFFPGPRDYEAEEDILYRNDGNKFTNVSAKVGLVKGGKGLTAVAADLDGDGDQDLFVANDSTSNFLYRNDGGRFTEIGAVAGVAYDPDGVETAAMGVDIADVDGDARPDLYVTNMVFEFNNLYLNQGNLSFIDATISRGLNKDNYRHVGWATRFADFNNDGYSDCFVGNGHVVDYVGGFSQDITYGQANMLFVGGADGRFKNVGAKVGKDFRRKRVSRGASLGDFDNDGDVDILINNSGERAELLRNDLPPGNHWIKIRLKGRPPNTRGIGAKVVVRLGDRAVSNEVRWASTYLSCSDPTLHLGLGPTLTEVPIEVTWPSGRRSSQIGRAGRLVIIGEPADPPAAK